MLAVDISCCTLGLPAQLHFTLTSLVRVTAHRTQNQSINQSAGFGTRKIQAVLSRELPSRTLTPPGAQVRRASVRVDHGRDGGIEAQNARDDAAEVVDEVEQIPQQLLLEAAPPAREPGVVVRHRARGRVEHFARQHGVALGLEAEHQERRERVRELQDAAGADEHDPAVDLGHGLGDDPGEDPIQGHQGDPDPFARLGFQDREVQQVAAEVVVQDFDADVAVQHRGDEARDEPDDVARRLPAVRRHPLVADVVHVLALHAVRVDAVHHVAGVDQDVGTE